MCGGTRAGIRYLRDDDGLSPRVRGNRNIIKPATNPPRSIPACAGEPPGFQRSGFALPVYPRVCGGTHLGRLPISTIRGLSPRVRGNPDCELEFCHDSRSIPACAGEPIPGKRRVPALWVYPRVCGGTIQPPPPLARCLGLSPRVRGNPGVRAPAKAGPGSIPACAGEPGFESRRRAFCRVYPRVCGGTMWIS